jgi:hypothetical protein
MGRGADLKLRTETVAPFCFWMGSVWSLFSDSLLVQAVFLQRYHLTAEQTDTGAKCLRPSAVSRIASRPTIPPRPRMACEQFDLGQIREVGFDQFVDRIRLTGVLAD